MASATPLEPNRAGRAARPPPERNLLMTQYTVHLYREMRLSYAGIEAGTPEDAASIARDQPTDEADDIDDCDGETLAALVDVAGDEDYRQSVTVDFEGERQRKAAPALLAALEGALYALDENVDG